MGELRKGSGALIETRHKRGEISRDMTEFESSEDWRVQRSDVLRQGRLRVERI